MEIVQTGTDTWPWCMSMFGARFAVFVRRARVLPSPCPATRNLSFLRVHRHRHPVVSTCCFTGLVRVGLNRLLNGNHMNMFWRVLMLHLNLLRTFRSVSATVARFLNPFITPMSEKNFSSDFKIGGLRMFRMKKMKHTPTFMTTLTRHDATKLHAKT